MLISQLGPVGCNQQTAHPAGALPYQPSSGQGSIPRADESSQREATAKKSRLT